MDITTQSKSKVSHQLDRLKLDNRTINRLQIEFRKFMEKNKSKKLDTFTYHVSGINTSKTNRRAIVSHCVPSHAKFHPTNEGRTAKT